MTRGVQRELVERARRGDHDAFSALVSTSIDRLLGTAVLMLRDRSAAEDIVQEALVRVWHDLPRLRDAERFDAWSYRILTRACYDHVRARRRRTAEIALVTAQEPVVDDAAVTVAERDALNSGLRRLSVEHRAALVLRHYSGLSVPDIAAAMAVPLGTAKSRLHHAERALRAALEAESRLAADLEDSSA